MSNINVKELTVKYELANNKSIITSLDNFSHEFKHGTITVVLGESGSGKTTLLKSIIGSILINGKILINGIDSETLSIRDKSISYVSQEFALYPSMSVFDNIAFPLSLIKASPKEIEKRVKEMASFLGIEAFLSRKPKELSIGQRQKVAFARALVKRSDIYLFDEPFSNLDKQIVEEIRPLLKNALKSMDATAILVTHESSDVFKLADEVIILEEGKLIFSGSIDDVFKSADEKVKAYF